MKQAIDINGVIRVFCALSGESGTDDKSAVVCRSAADTICRWLKSDVEYLPEMSRLCYAAGCLAYYRYILLDSVSGVQSFKSGDITVDTGGKNLESAKVILDQAVCDISPLLEERRFAFRRT